MVLVNIKWNKFTYSNISLDITQSFEIFKIQIFSLTGVPPERQKLISKGNWIGTLKDNVDLSTLNIKEGSVIMLMGTADVVIPPVSQITFLEDLNEEEKAVKGTVNPSGLQNLGNTCYMNSTIECLRHMPELREAFNRVYPTGPAQNFTVALRETFNSLDRSTQALPPIEFVVMLRSMFPQFAQTTQQGAYMQQDAEEFYTILIQTLQSGLSSSSSSTSTPSALNDLITFEVEETLTCAESSDETPKIHHEVVNKLVCNIQGGAGQNQSNVSVNHLSEGLNLSLNGTLEKYSDVLQRNAIWNKKQKIAKLPKYLCIQFMRFYWKLTPESMDHSGVKCKIMRPVTYTEIFDIYDYCTESLQQKLRISRDIAEKKREEYYNKRTRLLETVSENAPTDDMEVVKESSNESKNDTENLPQPPPSSTTLSTTNDSNVEQPIDDIRGLYELVGVVTHKGRSADSGHYIGWVRSNTDHSIWWKYDDDVVTQVTLQDVLNLKGGGDWHTAYLNFYRLRE